MSRKRLRIRATDRDADLIVVTDEGHTLAEDITFGEQRQVIAVLSNKLRAFYAAAQDRPCSHQLDALGAENRE